MTRVAHGATLAVFVIVQALVACHKAPPPPAPAPEAPAFNADSARRADSIRAAAQRRRDDSIAAAAAAARAAAARADSIAAANAASARTAEARRVMTAMVFFDYDAAVLRDDARATLDAKYAILNANPMMRIRIDGNADERGSDDYNLALGQRRAEAAKTYLVSRGVSADRIDTRSLGEDRPLAMGDDETAYTQNRRDEFEIVAGGTTIR